MSIFNGVALVTGAASGKNLVISPAFAIRLTTCKVLDVRQLYPLHGRDVRESL